VDSVEDWWKNNTGSDWRETRDKAMALLQKESELQEIVQLVGPDALPDRERITLETTRMIREDFLQQNAYHEVDTYCAPMKQYEMLKTIISYHENAEAALDRGAASADIITIPVKDDIGRMKYLPESEFEVKVKEIQADIIKQCSEV
jgi:V/A-type H+-transporting ATPase subunit A